MDRRLRLIQILRQPVPDLLPQLRDGGVVDLAQQAQRQLALPPGVLPYRLGELLVLGEPTSHLALVGLPLLLAEREDRLGATLQLPSQGLGPLLDELAVRLAGLRHQRLEPDEAALV